VANVCALTVCWGRTCGPDGCGGYCGQCAATDFCDHGNCAALAGTEPKQGDCSDKEECEPPENEGDRPPPPGFEPDATGGADASQSFLVEGEDGDGGGGSGCSVAAPNLGGPAACLLLLSLATMILAAPRTGRAGAR
jgi:hypothetical protein